MNRKLKTFIKISMYYAPNPLQKWFGRIQDKYELKEGLARAHRTKVVKEEFVKLINSLDINCDLMLHTSMINVGKIQGGSKFIAETILAKIDITHNTLLVSALPYRGSFKTYLDNNPIFDVRTAPIAMGAVNEYLSNLPNALRSIHPTHSVVAIGPQSIEYTASHHLDSTPFGVHSPYYKIIMNRGKILLVGATLNNLTIVHAIEDMLGNLHPIKCYVSQIYAVDCIDYNGCHLIVNTTCHDPFKGCIRDLEFLRADMIKRGIMTTIPLGEAELIILDAHHFTIFYLEMLQHGRSIYGQHKVTDKLYQKIEKLKNQLKE